MEGKGIWYTCFAPVNHRMLDITEHIMHPDEIICPYYDAEVDWQLIMCA